LEGSCFRASRIRQQSEEWALGDFIKRESRHVVFVMSLDSEALV